VRVAPSLMSASSNDLTSEVENDSDDDSTDDVDSE
jgi:hypothetical protein